MRQAFHYLSWAILLSLLAACKKDPDVTPEAEPDVLKIVSATEVTFDDADPANNTFTVQASEGLSWQAAASPAEGVRFSQGVGNGNGIFTLVEMPAGSTIDVYVKHSYADGRAALESNRVKVCRSETAITLEVSPDELQFDAETPSKNEVAVRSNAAWSVTATEGVVFSPAEGSGDGTIRITAAPEGESALTVTAGEEAAPVRRTVKITREATQPEPEPAGDPIYRLDFGNGATGWANQLESWKTQTGTGSEGVTYDVNYVNIKNDNFGSAGRYDGASGGAYAMLYYEPDTDYFCVGNITLPAGKTDFRLTFGTICRTDDLVLRLSADGRRWQDVAFSGAPAYNTWTLAECNFTLAQPVSKLYIRLVPAGIRQQYGLNFDDITLTESNTAGTLVELEEEAADYRWPELPANFETPAANEAVHTHWATTVRTNKKVRNYTYCYDTRRHNPLWVAYLLHSCYQEGGYTRPEEDPWAPDPSLDESLQSKIYPSNSGDKYIYYTRATLDYGASWTRGHLVMSSERGCGDRNNPALLNVQTFYPTNIAPQPSVGDYTFGTAWGYVEALFSGTNNVGNTEFTADDGATNINRVADTLFMVAGCHYGDASLIEKDGSYFSELSSASKDCTMPTYQFKVALRTRAGNTGKRIQECSAAELQAIGFWIPTFMTEAVTSGQIGRYAKSVAKIERLTGLTFFPDAPAEVKESFDHAEWGF